MLVPDLKIISRLAKSATIRLVYNYFILGIEIWKKNIELQ